jgi:arsenate reductase
MKTRQKVLVLCTGNSCRSIIAEALINHYKGDKWEAFSAGVSPSRVHPRSIKTLQELGIDCSDLRSKGVTEFLQRDDLDLVVTVCDHARETCPLFLKPVKQVHIGIADPTAHAWHSEEHSDEVFRKCRDTIKRKIVDKLDSLI